MSFFGRQSPGWTLTVHLEAMRLIEGETLAVLWLDTDPLLPRPLRQLLLRDRLEQESADPLATPARVKIKDEDLSDARADHAAASSPDHSAAINRDDPTIPSLRCGDLLGNALRQVILRNHRLDPLGRIDAFVGVPPTLRTNASDPLGVAGLSTTSDDLVHHTILLVRSVDAEAPRIIRSGVIPPEQLARASGAYIPSELPRRW